MKFQPVVGSQRNATLDIIRGFSLLGILLVNMFGFSLPQPHITDLADWFTEAKDIILQQYLDIYIQSSFYPLFSMLFGYGLAMQFLKSNETNHSFFQFAPRRLIALFVLGIFHAFFIWWGDIIAMYAFCGLFLMLLLKLRPMFLLTVAFLLNGLFHFFFLSLYKASGMFSMQVEPRAVDIMEIKNAITAYGTGTWGDAFLQRLVDLTIQMSPMMWISSLFTILPYMLVGAALAKWRVIERAREKIIFWLASAIVGISLGIFIKSLPISVARTYGYDYLQVYIGGPILAFGYMAAIVCICFVPHATKILSPIGKAGRMSMTLYIMQSIICTTIFYHWGFSLYGETDVRMNIFIALAIYVVQVIFAELWFSKFKQGPLEAIIKKVTYNKLLSEK